MNMRCGLCFLIIAFIFIAPASILLPSTMELLKVWGRGGKLQLHMGLCNSLKCDIVIAILQSFSAITSIWNISVVTLSFPCMLQFFPPLLRSLPLTSYLYLLHLLQALNLLSSPVSDCRYKFISSFLAQRYLFNPFLFCISFQNILQSLSFHTQIIHQAFHANIIYFLSFRISSPDFKISPHSLLQDTLPKWDMGTGFLKSVEITRLHCTSSFRERRWYIIPDSHTHICAQKKSHPKSRSLTFLGTVYP